MALTRITQGVIEPNQNYDTHNINSTGIITATGANISGNMSIGGVLTYEDVTNVDSVGLVTARSGMRFGGHILPTVNSAYDIGSADYKVRHLFLSDNSLKFVDSSDTEHPLSVDSGRLKFAGGMLLGNNIKMDTTSGIVTATSASFGPGILEENYFNDTGGGIQSDHTHDIVTYGMVFYGVTNAAGAWTFNIRGNASTTFDSLTNNNKVTTMTIYSANNNASNYMTAFKIDGTTQTVKWAGGAAPSAATGSGVDVYSMTIMKTAANTYHVFGNMTNFA